MHNLTCLPMDTVLYTVLSGGKTGRTYIDVIQFFMGVDEIRTGRPLALCVLVGWLGFPRFSSSSRSCLGCWHVIQLSPLCRSESRFSNLYPAQKSASLHVPKRNAASFSSGNQLKQASKRDHLILRSPSRTRSCQSLTDKRNQHHGASGRS